MPTNTGIEVVGAKKAVVGLRKIDPELRKQFNRDAKKVAQPVIDQAKAAYRSEYLSGMKRNWVQRGNAKFPYSVTAARAGVKFKIDTNRKAVSLLKIQQTNPAAVILDIAGRANPNPLGRALDAYGKASRIMWPAALQQLPKVTREMEDLVRAASRRVQKEL